MNETETMLHFIEKSPTAFHAVKNIASILEKDGFIRLREEETWRICPEKNYFVTRNDASVIAFKIPRDPYESFQIVAAHDDSPGFKIKEYAVNNGTKPYAALNCERYGGMILSSWLDRPLSIAGRVFVREENKIKAVLVDMEDEIVLIPNLAIHMERSLNEGYAYQPQTDMRPLFGLGEAGEERFLKNMADKIGVRKEDIIQKELFLYNRMPGKIWGPEKEFVSSPRLDDLQCVYAALEGFRRGKPRQSAAVLAVFDNEEVGSQTRQGADSEFLKDVLRRIHLSAQRTQEEFCQAMAQSFLVSADNAHALHPNHPEKADPDNKPLMNGGIVIKFSPKYATDGESAAVWREICRMADVPVQIYMNRSDIPGGATLGRISDSHISVPTVDIGLAQLAMHSSYETAGAKDTRHLIRAIEKFYGVRIERSQNGVAIR